MAISGTIKVAPQALKNASAQFGQSDQNVANLTNQMMEIANQLSSTWTGEAATGYYNKLRGLQGDVTKLHKMISEHVTDLVDMANVFEQAETASREIAGELKIDQIP